jgi:hypothetical protein
VNNDCIKINSGYIGMDYGYIRINKLLVGDMLMIGRIKVALYRERFAINGDILCYAVIG